MKQEHQEKIDNQDYIDADHTRKAIEDLKTAGNAANEARGKLKRLESSTKNTEADAVRKKVFQRIKEDRKQENKPSVVKITPDIENISAPAKQPPRTDKLSRCNKKERKLISRIFNIIMNTTDKSIAEKIIQKIEEEFK